MDDLFDSPDPYFVSNHEASAGVRIFEPAALVQVRLRLDADGLTMPDGPDDMANAGLFTLPRSVRNPQTIAMLARLAFRYGRFFAFSDQSLLSLWHIANGYRPTFNFADNFQTPFLTDPSVNISLDDVRVLHFSSARKPGTWAFERWDRVGPARARLTELFEYYRDLSF